MYKRENVELIFVEAMQCPLDNKFLTNQNVCDLTELCEKVKKLQRVICGERRWIGTSSMGVLLEGQVSVDELVLVQWESC